MLGLLPVCCYCCPAATDVSDTKEQHGKPYSLPAHNLYLGRAFKLSPVNWLLTGGLSKSTAKNIRKCLRIRVSTPRWNIWIPSFPIGSKEQEWGNWLTKWCVFLAKSSHYGCSVLSSALDPSLYVAQVVLELVSFLPQFPECTTTPTSLIQSSTFLTFSQKWTCLTLRSLSLQNLQQPPLPICETSKLSPYNVEILFWALEATCLNSPTGSSCSSQLVGLNPRGEPLSPEIFIW